MVIYQKQIYRSDLRNNPNLFYVFGDNAKHAGMGGQAREMRGEPNAIGIVTKRSPSPIESAFYRDTDHEEWYDAWIGGFRAVEEMFVEGRTIVWPSDGVGTGLARMVNTAPNLFKTMNAWFARLGIKNGTLL